MKKFKMAYGVCPRCGAKAEWQSIGFWYCRICGNHF